MQTLPELRRYQIASNGRCRFVLGYLYGDPRIDDGTFIKTARIIEHIGDVVTTLTKSYRLKEPA